VLTVALEKQLGTFSLNAQFACESGATALFGASGAGKTSVINMIAGLMRPDHGRIVLDGETLFDETARINVPAWRRRIGTVFQEGRLFPHMSVRHNLDYGRRMGGHIADAQAFAHVVDMLDIAPLLERRPGKLSGGERQRVAIGRALLMRPRLLLLDEPLASLDAARKADILPYLERLRDQARVPMIYVSHDASEVRRIASRVVRLEDGRVAADGGIDLLLESVMPREGGASSNPSLT
jgi:molybdate transport system ATP-binding protein